MLRQLQPFAQRFALFHAVRADQAQVIEICFCDGFSLYSAFFINGRARAAQGVKQNFRLHALDAELALLAALALALLLAVDVRYVGLQHTTLGDIALDAVADHESRAVGVGEEDDAPLLGELSQKGLLFLVVEHGEAAELHDDRVHDLRERVFVVPPLDDDDFLYLRLCHRFTSPVQGASAAA